MLHRGHPQNNEHKIVLYQDWLNNPWVAIAAAENKRKVTIELEGRGHKTKETKLPSEPVEVIDFDAALVA